MHILVCTSLRILGTTLRRNFSSGLTLGVWEVIKNVLEKVSVFNCPNYIDSKCYGSQPAVFICHSSSASLLHLTLWFFFSFHDAVNDIIIIIIYLNFFLLRKCLLMKDYQKQTQIFGPCCIFLHFLRHANSWRRSTTP